MEEVEQVRITKATMQAIGDAIRSKRAEETLYLPSEMPNAIETIPAGSSTLITKEITANGTYNALDDSADGYSEVTVNVSGGNVYNPPIVVNSNLKIDSGWIYNFQSGSNYFQALNDSGNVIDIDWSQPFEICVVFKLSSTSLSRAMTLFGALSWYYYAPSIDIQSGGSGIWCGFSTNGSSWTDSLAIGASDGITLQADTVYTVIATWDGTDYTVSLSDDVTTVTKSITPSSAHYHSSSYLLEFGGVAASQNNNAIYVSMYLPDMYISSNGVKVWSGASVESTLVTKSITSNGTYNPADDNADGYSEVTVNVSGGSTLGTKTITANGTYLASDDSVDGYSKVTVSVSGGGGGGLSASVGELFRHIMFSNSTDDRVSRSDRYFQRNTNEPVLFLCGAYYNGDTIAYTGYAAVSFSSSGVTGTYSQYGDLVGLVEKTTPSGTTYYVQVMNGMYPTSVDSNLVNYRYSGTSSNNKFGYIFDSSSIFVNGSNTEFVGSQALIDSMYSMIDAMYQEYYAS